MTLLAPNALVAAAKASTQAYLDLLADLTESAPEHRVERLKEQRIPAHIEGRLYHRYAARLPAGLKLRPDAHTLFTPDDDGRNPIPARLIEYNSHTGVAKLAFEEKLETTAGRLRIEHRQSVRRWLAWLESRGDDVGGLDEIAAGDMNIEQAIEDSKKDDEIITDRQLDAVRIILGAPLSFIHGPAGAGKTSVVLPRAVRALLSQGRRVLIAAWRDEVVDEALTALILDGVAEDAVFRIGVPTAPFLHAYPKCCEIQAADSNLCKSAGRLRLAQTQASTARRLCEMKEKLQQDQSRLSQSTKELYELDRRFREMSEQVRRLDLKTRGLHNEFFRSQSKLTGERRKRSELHMPEIEREKKIIQTEYDFIAKTIRTLQQELAGKSGLGSLLGGGKKKQIEEQIKENEAHLAELKAKLEELDQRVEYREDSYKDLTGHIYNDETITGSMDTKLMRMRDQLSELRPKLEFTETQWQVARSDVKKLSESVKAQTIALEAFVREHGIDDVDATIARLKELEHESENAEIPVDEAAPSLENRRVVGMTLDALIGFDALEMTEADWVFVDEAHCAPVVKMLPLLTLKRPVAMLGDLRHLPPYCDKRAGREVQAWWAKPAPFLEDVFRDDLDANALLALETPRFDLTTVGAINQSFILGPGQSSLLERYICDEPMDSRGAQDLPILIHHCEPFVDAHKIPGVNESEAEEAVDIAIRMAGRDEALDAAPSLAILTPGEAQAEFIREMLRHRGERLADMIDVLAVHRAQGLRWDHVLFSVTSTKRMGETTVPPESLCSAMVEGRSLLHTVLTRARRELIILMDRTDWVVNDPPCLLTELARTGKLYELAE